MKIGYIRVSTKEQNTIRQEYLMESLGVEEVYIDRMSGKNTHRPELKKMLDYVRKGDTVVASYWSTSSSHSFRVYSYRSTSWVTRAER